MPRVPNERLRVPNHRLRVPNERLRVPNERLGVADRWEAAVFAATGWRVRGTMTDTIGRRSAAEE